jgi:hypothetical protein
MVAQGGIVHRGSLGSWHADAASIAEIAEVGVGQLTATAIVHDVVVEIGAMPVLVRTSSPEFLAVLEKRYGGFMNPDAEPSFEFDVEVVPPSRLPGADDADVDLSVVFEDDRWILERGDFHAELDSGLRRGEIRLAASPYAIDAAFRVVHSLLLAKQGGLLVHASSAVKHGKAFLFAGVSGAGKTTISRLAPPDATLLTDEISYIRREGDGYVAYGTPFAGELAKPGENIRAPLAALYLLKQGPENRIEPVGAAEATRAVLESVLFFAHDAKLVGKVFDSVCELVQRVPVQRLTFLPDSRVWELIV